MKKTFNIRTLIYYALLIALTTIMTLISWPVPATNGYINLGDMVVFVAALMLGKTGGFVVGSIGSSLADILLGYTHYAPITFVVKGLEGLLTGFLVEKNVKPAIATTIGGIFMACGYLVAELYLYGKAAFVSFPGNIGQGLVGSIIAILVYKRIKNVNISNL